MQITIQSETGVKTVQAEAPILLSEAIRQSGLAFAMPCGGRGKCGKCAVQAAGRLSAPSQSERETLGPKWGQGYRLACLARAEGDCAVTLASTGEASILTEGRLPAFALEPAGSRYGFAVDIGTTTVAVYFYELAQGRLLRRASFPNPQASYGADVISRVQAALEGEAEPLSRLILTGLSDCFARLCEETGVRPSEVDAIVLTGNTAMLYLLCKQDVTPLSRAPFVIAEYYGGEAGVRFERFPEARALLPRCISAFVGADITCCILSSDMYREENAIAVDIGTNGEMALSHGSGLFCCSTAAGPAFEGAGITMGTAAVEGAVSRVFAQEDSIGYETIGGAPACGICGSGLIDAVAVCLACGMIDETGRIEPEEENPFARYCTEYEGQPAIRLGESGVILTQKDVRAVQLAKSAICAGILSLLHEAGVAPGAVSTLYLAGGFGSVIRPESAAAIGLFPAALAPKTVALGNAAGMGAILYLLSQEKAAQGDALAKEARTLELSTSDYFMEQYVENMLFETP